MMSIQNARLGQPGASARSSPLRSIGLRRRNGRALITALIGNSGPAGGGVCHGEGVSGYTCQAVANTRPRNRRDSVTEAGRSVTGSFAPGSALRLASSPSLSSLLNKGNPHPPPFSPYLKNHLFVKLRCHPSPPCHPPQHDGK